MGLRYLRMRPTVARIMDDRILPNVNKRTGWNDALHFTVRHEENAFAFRRQEFQSSNPVEIRDNFILKRAVYPVEAEVRS